MLQGDWKGLDAKIYFTHPYSAWENGTIENTNKLIRQYIPKNAAFCEFDELKLKEIQVQINKRPRKNLGIILLKKNLGIILKNKSCS